MVLTPGFTADSPWLEQLLARLPSARVAVFGDLCLDVYWQLDPEHQSKSIETGLPVRTVRSQRFSPGGAGNVAANLAALGLEQIELFGIIGPDLYGDALLRQFSARRISVGGIVRGPHDWQTAVYVKPCLNRVESNRFDFGINNPWSAETWELAIKQFEATAARCPVAVINQQVTGGWPAEPIAMLQGVIARHPQTLFIVDSRDHAAQFPSAALKLNLAEAQQMLPGFHKEGHELAHALATALCDRQGLPVIITRSDQGLVLATRTELCDVPGVELPGAVDAVGAGDTALAALAAAIAARASWLEAATFANLAAAITARQVGTTGVATPEKLRAVGPSPDYIYHPHLAASPRLARKQPGTEIELVTQHRPTTRIRHAIFDHDGTLSTLRQGWEHIMEPMMIKAVLGPRSRDVDNATYDRVTATVRAFIDRTTGIQTLAQMKGLRELVAEFGFVPSAEILDEHGYKALYNEELLAMVRTRSACIARGELSPYDWQIKNARPLLERLRDTGVKLYLASGTDEGDVVAEARALGYADLFDGGIFGAVGDLKIEAKREVLARIVKASAASGAEIVVFGDGPVEIREGRRRGAFTVGVASDEIRRYGLDLRKRTRLIRAGADIIVSDFAQLDALLALLGLCS